MELVSIVGVKPGQVLARAVTARSGAVLCPAGFRLTESAIEHLKHAGIESVVVEGGESERATAEERIAELNRRFESVDDPIMLQIKATIENRLASMQLEQDARLDKDDSI